MTEQIRIPEEMDRAILLGIEKGRRYRKKRIRSRIAIGTGCLFILAALLSVRFSPAVAAYVGSIPGLKALVEMLHYDKGLQLALKNDFIEPLGMSQEKDGIELVMDGMLADESRVILFYTLNNKAALKGNVDINGVKLEDGAGNWLDGYSVSYGSTDVREDWKTKQGQIDFSFQDGTAVPDRLRLNLRLLGMGEAKEARADPGWKFEIPVDKSKLSSMKETYAINQSATVEGQRITFGTMTVYPTRIGVEVNFDPHNTKKILSFDDIAIVDEHGEKFGTIMNGVTASHKSEDSIILYFQSNYFLKPKELYIEGGSMRALDKNKLEVKIDLKKKRLLTKPDDRLSLEGMTDTVLHFRLHKDDSLDEGRRYSVFSSLFTDASGKEFHSSQMGFSNEDIQYDIPRDVYLSPLTLKIDDYPARIQGNIHIKVK
ncbi:DUF4179 domain-containing protein [Paenibacillus caui]|uniref:DUF4179 domain-containing protein n=1 Tax=Paenibacillus caui TaxID=2873927 RepID=UPI001CA90D42|nr:DUF4179 domain-containing protein [Paenibacillus caui]